MMKNFGVRTFQAEDEIAAMSVGVGAAFAGEIAATASSGPGICLKGEAMGLGVMTELPMVIVDVQRGGPSTGLPTKTEQADLLLAMFGRNGDSPLPIVAAASPGRLLRHGPGGGAHRRRVHDAGDLPDRWLHRQRVRAVAHSEVRRPEADRGQASGRDTPATRERHAMATGIRKS